MKTNNHSIQYCPQQNAKIVAGFLLILSSFFYIVAGIALSEVVSALICVSVGIVFFGLAKWCYDQSNMFVCFRENEVLIFEKKCIEVRWDDIFFGF